MSRICNPVILLNWYTVPGKQVGGVIGAHKEGLVGAAPFPVIP